MLHDKAMWKWWYTVVQFHKDLSKTVSVHIVKSTEHSIYNLYSYCLQLSFCYIVKNCFVMHCFVSKHNMPKKMRFLNSYKQANAEKNSDVLDVFYFV